MSSCCQSSCGCHEIELSPVDAGIQSLRPGDSAHVVGYHSGNAAYLDKILSMGLVRGTLVHVVRVAPMGDPIDLRVRNYHLTLRKDEAAILKLEKV